KCERHEGRCGAASLLALKYSPCECNSRRYGMGGAVMCTWTDCVAEAEPDFTEWYNRQHLAERVAVPGFLSGARYVAVRGRPKYLAYYEWESTAVGPTPAYMERQNNPTRWTRRIMRAFRNTIRTVFRRR